jgi:hypothetical protein
MAPTKGPPTNADKYTMVSPRLKYPRVNGKYTLRTMVAAVTKAVKTTVKAIWEDFTVS